MENISLVRRWDGAYLVLGALVVRGHHLLREVYADALRGIRRESLPPVSLYPYISFHPGWQATKLSPPDSNTHTHPREKPRAAGIV